ncbi:PAS domain S-box protein [Pseudochrobactrum sp. sp1633]|uniref:sensor histidine kinase n=1 Tax=Pseudochrobactrum sp. sp1633 TaxID=3036706 RepID=UPI0025A55F63|nr:PAS domain-containing sensor histidine kinase [Pseudochrobactrum sp. sp1633]MDM8345757.1 PAS domain S-box protein [Pseudochrobactrum sp. sp1633]HWD12461.1 PAS domain S-box protein [Pseudochrobactrum sp.]
MKPRPAALNDHNSSSKSQTGFRLTARDYTLIIPLLAILLIVTLTVTLLWMTSRDNQSETEKKLTTDALWVEQYLRFQLQTFETELRDLATDIGRDPQQTDHIRAQIQHLVSIHSEFIDISWFSPDGNLLESAPPGLNIVSAYKPALADHSRLFGKPVYSSPRHTTEGWAVDMVAPVYTNNRSAGSLWVILSLDRLLSRNVPWWVAGKYQVSLTDAGGDALLSKSSIMPTNNQARHTISFDPPLTGTYITVTPYQSRPAIGPIVVSAAIISLTILVIINLWMAYRQNRRRAAAEHALRTEYAFRQAMENSLTIGMRARDRNGRIIYVNPEFCRMVGYEEKQLIGMVPPHPYWAPEIMSEGIQRQNDMRSTGIAPHQFETRFIRPNGVLIDVLVYEAPLIDADGTHIGWMGSLVDVTERKKLEEARQTEAEKLQHNARLITMGEMASTLAHELNQPLAAITSYATGSLNLLNSGTMPMSELGGVLQKLSDQAQRAGTIVHRVHDFVRKRSVTQEQHDLRRIVQDATSFVTGDILKSGGKIDLRLPDAPVSVRADAVLIQQVLLNLIRNAHEAAAGLPRNRQTLHITLETGHTEAVITITDHGHGIPADMENEIFTPFISSKSDGMGMGLPICRSILESHKGRLWLSDTPDKQGASFCLSLPLAAQEKP